jgi:Desulfoferrodoxin
MKLAMDLSIVMEPKVVFQIAENEVVLEVLAYCNKHGLWAAKLD